MTNLILSRIAFPQIDYLHSSRTFDLWALGLSRAQSSVVYNADRLLFPLRLSMEVQQDLLTYSIIASGQGTQYSPLIKGTRLFEGIGFL